MKISPIAKKIFILGYILIPIFMSSTLSFLIYYYETSLIREGYFTLLQTLVMLNSIILLVFVAIFINTYRCLKSNFKQFESKFANLNTIIKAIEYIGVSDITVNAKNYEVITFDIGIDIGGNRNHLYCLENQIVPEHSYMHYLITKKIDEYNQKNADKEAQERTETIINKMKKSWED